MANRKTTIFCVVASLLLAWTWMVGSAVAQVNNDPAADNTLTIKINGIRAPGGRLACALFWKNKGFPRKHRRALRRTWVDVEAGTATCVFKRTGLGDYAASVFVDENRNGKLDTDAIGSPSEPWGVSKDAKAKRFGPPIFKEAKFAYPGGPMTIEINLNYDDD